MFHPTTATMNITAKMPMVVQAGLVITRGNAMSSAHSSTQPPALAPRGGA